MRSWYVKSICAVLGGALLLAASAVRAEGWGTIKGRVVWGPAELPKPKALNVDKDKAHCLSKGPIYSEEFVVNPKNRGVRWAVVYLMDEKSFSKPLPIHPSLKASKVKEVVVDQPCCKFEPHTLAIRDDQMVVVKNSAPIPHNVNVTGGALGPNLNQILPPGGKLELKEIAPRQTPIQIACNIHGWMKGYLFVFKHPYFAVTDADGNFEIKNAPAGKYRVVIWEEVWAIGDNDKPSKKGKLIEIKADGTTDLGKVPLNP